MVVCWSGMWQCVDELVALGERGLSCVAMFGNCISHKLAVVYRVLPKIVLNS